MRLISIAALVIFTTQAFANDLICELQVSPTRMQTTAVDIWPTMMAQMSYRDCMGNGGFQICFEKGGDSIADQAQVCGYGMNVRWDCRTQQRSDNAGNHVVETNCPRWGVTARLVVNANGQGRIACMRGNHVERTWRLGACY